LWLQNQKEKKGQKESQKEEKEIITPFIRQSKLALG
jgi:hypothetical protein